MAMFWSFLDLPTFLAFLRDKGLKILVLFAPLKMSNYGKEETMMMMKYNDDDDDDDDDDDNDYVSDLL